MHIKSSNYTFVKEQDLAESLEKHKNHRRMKVFYHKGTKCSMKGCDRVGTRFIRGRDTGGNLHVDVYTDNLVLMTIDHVVPVSLGGSNDLSNKVPMCCYCNWNKGSKFAGTERPNDQEELGYSKAKRKHLSRYMRRWRNFVKKRARFELANISYVFYHKKIAINELHNV